MANRPDINFDSTNLQVFMGEDPCITCLHDSSINRTVAPNEWMWDFGDRYRLCGFELPGDNYLFSSFQPGDTETTDLETLLDTIGGSGLPMRPLKPDSYGADSEDTLHYTGIWIKASDRSANGTVNLDEDPETRVVGTSTNPVEVKDIYLTPNSCGKTARTAEKYTYDSCGGRDVFGNGVYHVYKGAGVYPVYLSSITRGPNQNNTMINRVGYDAMENQDIPVEDMNVNCGVVVVRPRCPCFFDFAPKVDGTDLDLRCIGITSPNYSCRYTEIEAATGYLNVNTELGLVSAYAPFMRVGVDGKIKPMSFPIKNVYWDWCDWFSDFSDEDISTYIGVPEDSYGWKSHWLGVDEVPVNCRGVHTYTMPGLYSLYFDYEYLTGTDDFGRSYNDIANAIEMLEMFVDIDCSNTPILKDEFLVVEIPPRFADSQPIVITDRSENENKTELIISGVTVKDRLSAGSYPIERIDWDFGDGTPIFSVFKNEYIDDIASASAWNFGDSYTSADYDPTDYTYTYLNGCSADKVFEPYVEDYLLTHKYRRTNVDVGYTYTISCTAYAENTHTSVTTSIVVNGFDSLYPSFSGIEGGVNVVDTRNYGGADDVIIVFGGKNSKELYHVKVEDK